MNSSYRVCGSVRDPRDKARRCIVTHRFNVRNKIKTALDFGALSCVEQKRTRGLSGQRPVKPLLQYRLRGLRETVVRGEQRYDQRKENRRH